MKGGGGGQQCMMKSRSTNPGRGVRNPGRGTPIEFEECDPSRGVLKTGSAGMECGIQHRSDNPDRGGPVEIDDLPYQAE